jgi:predicted AAA+ superfamily ATPase
VDPWYKHAVPRREVREGRSFSPDEFAIALEQVIAGTAPDDYTKPDQFFARTCFTRALREHAGMVLRRLSGETNNTAPVLTLITQFGGGKTHTRVATGHRRDRAFSLDASRTRVPGRRVRQRDRKETVMEYLIDKTPQVGQRG